MNSLAFLTMQNKCFSFLTVCYREADDGQEVADQGQLDAFVEEVEKEGRMTENTKQFLEKLKEDKPKESQSRTSRNKVRYVTLRLVNI